MAESDKIFNTSIPVLSHLTYREAHAFENGFYVGFTAYPDRKHGYTKEKHYWRMGFVAGWLLKIAVILYAVPRLSPLVI